MGSQVDKTVAITWFEKAIYGYKPISLSEMLTTAEPKVMPGFVEVGNEIYEFDTVGGESITGWGAIPNSTQAYIYIYVSGSTASGIFSDVAPTWMNSRQGWYYGNYRAIWSVYKDGSGNYTKKAFMPGHSLMRNFGNLYIDGNIESTGYLTAKGISTDTPTIEIVSKAIADGTATEYSDSFSIEKPSTLFCYFSGPTVSGTVLSELQIYINSTWVSFAGGSFSLGDVNTSAGLPSPQALNPGLYRLKFTKSGTVSTCPDAQVLLIGVFGNGNTI